MDIQKKKRISLAKALAPAAAGIVLLSLAACGSSASADGASQSAGQDGKSSIKVVVAPIQYETAYIAQEQGYFKAEGLTVDLVRGADPAANLAQVVSGQADITTGSWENVATAISQGMPVKVISGNGVVDSKSDNSGILVSKNSNIKTVADLKGKNVAVNGVKTGGDIPMLQAAEAAGVDPKSINEVAVPYSGMQAALEQGTVDAAFPADAYYHQMVTAGFKTLSNPVREFQSNMPVTVWTTTQSWLDQNSGTAKKFNAAMAKASAFYADPANVNDVVAISAKVNQVDASKINPKNYVPVSVPINLTAGQAGIDAMQHLGFIPDKLTTDKILWSGAPTSKG